MVFLVIDLCSDRINIPNLFWSGSDIKKRCRCDGTRLTESTGKSVIVSIYPSGSFLSPKMSTNNDNTVAVTLLAPNCELQTTANPKWKAEHTRHP